jgi:hypothetical protein
MTAVLKILKKDNPQSTRGRGFDENRTRTTVILLFVLLFLLFISPVGEQEIRHD